MLGAPMGDDSDDAVSTSGHPILHLGGDKRVIDKFDMAGRSGASLETRPWSLIDPTFRRS